jgi:hypothetical protein
VGAGAEVVVVVVVVVTSGLGGSAVDVRCQLIISKGKYGSYVVLCSVVVWTVLVVVVGSFDVVEVAVVVVVGAAVVIVSLVVVVLDETEVVVGVVVGLVVGFKKSG